MESLRMERYHGQSGIPEPFKDNNEESSYKLTEDQHRQICIFVEEKNRVLQSDAFKLYAHLIQNTKEVEAMSIIVQSLKDNNRDVENCVDDLKVHPFLDDRSMYQTIEKNDKLIKNITTEYSTYKRNIKDYKGFREAALDLLRQYNGNQQDTRSTEYTPELGEKRYYGEEFLGTKEISPNEDFKKDLFNERPQRSQNNGVDNNITDYRQVEGVLGDNAAGLGRKRVLFDRQAELERFNKLLEGLNQLRENESSMRKMSQTVQDEIEAKSARGDRFTPNDDQRLNNLRQTMIRESQSNKVRAQQLGEEVSNLQQELKEDAVKKNSFEKKEYDAQLKELNKEIELRNQAIKEIEKSSFMNLSQLMNSYKFKESQIQGPNFVENQRRMNGSNLENITTIDIYPAKTYEEGGPTNSRNIDDRNDNNTLSINANNTRKDEFPEMENNVGNLKKTKSSGQSSAKYIVTFQETVVNNTMDNTRAT